MKAQEILDQNQQDLEASVYFFLQGRLHALEGNWAEARIAFLKSQKILPRSETFSNLKMVEEKMVVREIEAPRSLQDHLIHKTYFFGTELALTFNLALLVWGLWHYKRMRSVKSFMSIVVVMLLLSGLSLWTRHWPWAVAEKEISVYHGPSEIFDKVEAIPKGIQFLGTEKDSWIHIIYPSRFAGWIKKENISEL